jgi:hypothetical protein
VPCIVRDLLEALSLVVAAPCVDLHRLVCDVHLHAIAFEFDLVYPAGSAWDLLYGSRERGFDEAEKGSLDADGSWLLTLERR